MKAKQPPATGGEGPITFTLGSHQATLWAHWGMCQQAHVTSDDLRKAGFVPAEQAQPDLRAALEEIVRCVRMQSSCMKWYPVAQAVDQAEAALSQRQAPTEAQTAAGQGERCLACDVLLSSLPEKRFANINLSNRLAFCSFACAESANSCGIPSKTLGPCQAEWGHDGAMHDSEGDGFFNRDHEVEHQRRQRVRAWLVTPEPSGQAEKDHGQKEAPTGETSGPSQGETVGMAAPGQADGQPRGARDERAANPHGGEPAATGPAGRGGDSGTADAEGPQVDVAGCVVCSNAVRRQSKLSYLGGDGDGRKPMFVRPTAQLCESCWARGNTWLYDALTKVGALTADPTPPAPATAGEKLDGGYGPADALRKELVEALRSVSGGAAWVGFQQLADRLERSKGQRDG